MNIGRILCIHNWSEWYETGLQRHGVKEMRMDCIDCGAIEIEWIPIEEEKEDERET